MKAALILALALHTVASCKSRAFNAPSHTFDSTEFRTKKDAEHFAAIFRKIVGDRYKDSEVRQLLYFPTPAMYDVPSFENGSQFFKNLGASYRKITPDDLYEAGQGVSLATDSLPDLHAMMRKRPITLIVVPGVFGEFIKTRTMEEVFANTRSFYAREVAAAFARATDPQEKVDEHFSLKELRDVESPLNELIDAGSIDDADGRPLVRVIGFSLPFMSLESLGTNAGMGERYARRLDKFFRIVGTPENIVLLGYSRGASLALEMMTRAKHASWFRNVRAMVGLGGVLYGSDIADQMLIPGTKLNGQIAEVRKLVTDLQELDDVPVATRPAVVAKNSAAWASFLVKIARSDPELLREAWENNKGVNLRGMFRLGVHFWRALNLDNFVADYSDNIRRFKRFVAEALLAGEELTTTKRLEWWQTHTLPHANITYYALAAVMADPETARMGREAAANRVSYDAGSADYRTLLSGCREFKDVTGFSVNDSQVALHKAQFWPELHPRLNPQQKPLDMRFLGILGTHHWALALRVVNEMANGETNPFPREDLLKAIAAKIALDLEK